MNKKTFKDPSVMAYLNANFVSIRINSDVEKKIASNYGVRGVPITWFIKKNGKKIGPIPGYIPPDTFLSMLKSIQATQK
jgi:thioredoxin-related protein